MPGLLSKEMYDITEVVKTFGVTIDEIMKNKPKGKARQAKQTAMYILRNYHGMSLNEIGYVFNVNHATVIHNVTQVGYDLCMKNPHHELISECISKKSTDANNTKTV